MAKYELKGEKIILKADSEKNVINIKYGNTEWNTTELPFVMFSDESVEELKKPTDESTYDNLTATGIVYEYKNIGDKGIDVKTVIEVEKITDNVCFYCSVTNDEFNQIDYVNFPAAFDFGVEYGDSGENNSKNLPECYTVLPRMQGMLVPAGTKIILYDKGVIYERDGRMPFFGQVRWNDGYVAIFETPYDARYDLKNEKGEKVAPLWRTSMGRMSYKRKIRYVFIENCDYIAIAKAYRSYVKSRGNLVTLKDKIALNEKAKEMIGCPIIPIWIAAHKAPESPYYNKENPESNNSFVPFAKYEKEVKELHEKGLKKAYIHVDGWGSLGFDNRHPCPLPPHKDAGGPEAMKSLSDTVKDCGYVFAVHDNYRDYYFTAPDFTYEKSVLNADGSYPVHSLWLGGNQTLLCASVARDYVRHNYTQMARYGINIDSTYFDVFSCTDMDECYNPDHPMTREQCAKYRRECFDYMTSRGIFSGSEEANDCIIPSLVYCHYEPYRTEPLISNVGKTPGILVPLYNLVYHDCLIIPWRSDKGVRGGIGIPETDSAYDHAILNGGPVTLTIDADEKHIEEATFACEHAGRLALMQMVNHEFLSEDRRIQRTTFKDGDETVTVEVNFDTEEYKISN